MIHPIVQVLPIGEAGLAGETNAIEKENMGANPAAREAM